MNSLLSIPPVALTVRFRQEEGLVYDPVNDTVRIKTIFEIPFNELVNSFGSQPLPVIPVTVNPSNPDLLNILLNKHQEMVKKPSTEDGKKGYSDTVRSNQVSSSNQLGSSGSRSNFGNGCNNNAARKRRKEHEEAEEDDAEAKKPKTADDNLRFLFNLSSNIPYKNVSSASAAAAAVATDVSNALPTSDAFEAAFPNNDTQTSPASSISASTSTSLTDDVTEIKMNNQNADADDELSNAVLTTLSTDEINEYDLIESFCLSRQQPLSRIVHADLIVEADGTKGIRMKKNMQVMFQIRKKKGLETIYSWGVSNAPINAAGKYRIVFPDDETFMCGLNSILQMVPEYFIKEDEIRVKLGLGAVPNNHKVNVPNIDHFYSKKEKGGGGQLLHSITSDDPRIFFLCSKQDCKWKMCRVYSMTGKNKGYYVVRPVKTNEDIPPTRQDIDAVEVDEAYNLNEIVSNTFFVVYRNESVLQYYLENIPDFYNYFDIWGYSHIP